MLRLAILTVTTLLAVGSAHAQPILGWVEADTLYADRHDQFVHVPAPASPAVAGRGAAATFDIEYVNLPAEAEAAFQFAADIWSQHLESSVPIRVRAEWKSEGDGDVLGSTNPRVIANFERAPSRSVWFAVALANALAGRDLDPDEPHINMSLNSDFNGWYFGTDGQTPSGRFDFVTIVLHELGHGLGFVGSMLVENGEGLWGIGTQDFPVIFDRFAELGDGRSLLDEDRFPNPSDALGDALTSESVFFNGDAANRAQEGRRPQLHAPPSWQSGSSYSHLSEQTANRVESYPPGSLNALMTPTISSAESIHAPGPVVCGMFQDMGWALAPACASQVPGGSGTPTEPKSLEVDYRGLTNPISERLGGTATLLIRSTSSQHVDVNLIDVLGRRVAVLFQGTADGGEDLFVNVDVSGLAAGVYFVWIESPDFFESQPLTVIR